MQQLASSLSELYVPPHAYRLLMDEAVSAVCEHMVEGYSQIKKVRAWGCPLLLEADFLLVSS